MKPDDLNLHMGKQLRTRRTMLGLSQEALGKAIGIASQQVQKYEKGINVMSAIRLYQFAEFLKVQVAYFYEGLEKNKGRTTQSLIPGIAEERLEFEAEAKIASDRETLEVLKSFKAIKDHVLRKRVADLLRTMSCKNV